LSAKLAKTRGLVVTQGDPAGIGPELILHAAALDQIRAGDVVFADPAAMAQRALALGTPWAAAGWSALQGRVAGEPGMGQFAALQQGVDHVLGHPGMALVTAPIDKARAQSEGLAYPGHTEYLAARSGASEVAMLMCGPRLRVGLATVHVPLRRVPELLRTEDVVRVGHLLCHALIDVFEVGRPRVAVLGLNPHAGEQGTLGDEEDRVIVPGIDALQARWGDRARFFGPVPADSAFFAHAQGTYDGIVAMYHDQALAPFKLLHFDDGVNMTLGLPFVRTSPDHGTAVDIAGRGVARPGSMLAAIRLARGGPG
jgi:4-hydroxythreonine-4-phosphate dehydrogenase